MDTKVYVPTENFGRHNFLRAEMYYSKGGVNVWSGRNESRGIYLSVKPVERSKDGICEGFTISGQKSDGYRVCLKELARKNDNALEKLWRHFLDNGIEEVLYLFDEKLYQDSVNKACEIAGLQ